MTADDWPFDAHRCHMGTAIKHAVLDRVKPSECPDVKLQMTTYWHKMLYSCSVV